MVNLSPDSEVAQLAFKEGSANQPIINALYEHFRIETNIVYGNVEILADEIVGYLVVIFKGDQAKREEAYKYLNERNISLTFLQHIETDDGFDLVPRSIALEKEEA